MPQLARGDRRRRRRQRRVRLRPGVPRRAGGRARCATCCRAARRVVRDGRPREIDAVDLVVGDLVLLEAGDRVSADLRLCDAHGLARRHVDAHRRERPGRQGQPGDASSPARFVVEGEADGRGHAPSARDTRLAGDRDADPAQSTAADEPARRASCDRVVRIVAVIAVGVGVAFFGIAPAARACHRRRLPLRHRRDRRARPRGAAADGHAVAGASAPSAWPRGTRWSAASSRSRRSARRPSSAPTRPARSPATRWRSSRSGRRPATADGPRRRLRPDRRRRRGRTDA